MMAKLKAAKEQGAAKIAEMKEQKEAADQAKWREEVMDGDKFKDFQGWADVYEPKKEKKDKESGGPNAVEKAAAKKMTENITRDILKTLFGVVSQLLGPASAALAQSEKEVSDVINAADGAALTYRFRYKGEKKMAYFRGLAAERLALALGAALEAQSKAAGHAEDAKLDPAQVKEIVDAVVAKATAEIAKKQDEAVAALKESPLFAASGADAGQVDAGVVALQDFLRGYMESKIGVIVQVLEQVLGKLLEVGAKHKEVIKKQAANAAEGAEGFQAAKDDILKEIETAHDQLDTAVGKYVGDLVNMLVLGGAGGDDDAAAE